MITTYCVMILGAQIRCPGRGAWGTRARHHWRRLPCSNQPQWRSGARGRGGTEGGREGRNRAGDRDRGQKGGVDVIVEVGGG